MKLQIKILDPKIREKMPSYASLGSAGLASSNTALAIVEERGA